MMWSRLDARRRRGRTGRLGPALALMLLGAAPAAAGPAPPAEGRLSLSLPEVVVESPDVERLIAQRVRPAPPGRLGVRLPDILVEAEVPPVTLPPRPIPSEREPDPDLTGPLGRLSRMFGDQGKVFETGLAYMKKGSPVEALTFFEEVSLRAKELRLRAAGLFWGGETALRLGRPEEARRKREEILRLPSKEVEPYSGAARFALAEERCGAGDYQACLRHLDGSEWSEGTFAAEEARFLRAWTLDRLGARGRALDAWALQASGEGPLALKAAVTLGHRYYEGRDYAKAERRYAQAEAAGSPGGEAQAALLGEALHGLGWVGLQIGRPDAAARAFSLFLRRHPSHPLGPSAEAGALVARIETAPRVEGQAEILLRAVEEFARGFPQSPQEASLRLQLAWALFRRGDYAPAARLAAAVSDAHPLGRIYRVGRIIEGLGSYHLGDVKRAYGVLRLGADRPPAEAERQAERSAARSAAMATAFAAFRLRDFLGARDVLEGWAFPPGAGDQAADPEAALWYGEAAFEAGDLEGARRAFASVPPRGDEHMRARAGLAWIHYRRREWREASRAFDEVFEMAPEGPLAPEALARAGEARFNLGDHGGALQSFERIERQYAGREVAREALLQKGKLLFRRDRFEEAEAAFRLYLERHPGSEAAPEVEFWRALVPFRRGDFAAARERLLEFAQRRAGSPLAADAYLRAGDAFYNEGRYLQAEGLYRLVMARFPGHPRAREAAYGLILTRLQREEFAAFLQEARRFIDLYPGAGLSIALAFQVGEVHLTRGEVDEAHKAYRDVVTRYPEGDLAAHALLRIAGIHRRRRNIDAALDAYETLLARYPASRLRADALFGAGETLAGIGRCPEARQRLEDFLARHPTHDYALLARYELGRCAARLGDEAAAATHLRAVVDAQGGGGEGVRAGAALLLGALLSRQEKLEEAERALDVALRSSDPAVAAEALYSRAELRLRRGDPGAGAEFLKLTYQYPDQTMWVVRALARAGEFYEKAGNRATALRIFQKMRQVAPPGALRERAEEAVRRLEKPPAPGR